MFVFLVAIGYVAAVTVGLAAAFAYSEILERIGRILPATPALYLAITVVFVVITVLTVRDIRASAPAKRETDESPRWRLVDNIVTWLSVISLVGVTAMSASAWVIASIIVQRDPSTQKAQFASIGIPGKREIVLVDNRGLYLPSGNLFELRFSYPRAMYLQEDGLVNLTGVTFSPKMASALREFMAERDPEFGFGMPGGNKDWREDLVCNIRLESPSFGIVPQNGSNVPMVAAVWNTQFVVSPKEIGTRRILIRSTVHPEAARYLSAVADTDHSAASLTIEVLPPRTFLGITFEESRQLALICTSIGFPSLTVLLLTLWLDRFKRDKDSRLKRGKRRRRRTSRRR